MFKPKVDLTGQEWIDALFEERNKEYGAYDLRMNQSKMTLWALLIGTSLFTLLLASPLIFMNNEAVSDGAQDPGVQIITVKPYDPPAPDPEIQKIVQPRTEVKSLVEVKRFVNPVIGPERDNMEEFVSQKYLENIKAGFRNVAPSDDGEIPITETASDRFRQGQIIEASGTGTPVSAGDLDISAGPVGGIGKFREYIARELGGITLENGLTQLQMTFTFVVEKNGELTNVKVVRDGGYPEIAQRAATVILNSEKWEPGVKNGRKTSSTFNLPITIQVVN